MSFKGMLNTSIKTYAYTVGAAPYYKKTYNFTADVDAAVHELTGREQVINTGKEITADIRVFVESVTISEGDRIKYNSKIYEVVHMDRPMRRGHHTELMCSYLPNEAESNYSDS